MSPDLVSRIRAIVQSLADVEAKMLAVGNDGRDLFLNLPNYTFINEWKAMAVAAANVAIIADEFMHPTPPDP